VQKDNPQTDRLENFPVTFFAVVMGMLGLTLAAHAAETAFGASTTVSTVVLAVSVIIMLAISALYGAKA
jgi:tellurite resistance protein